jgi:seryl-tRNA synthetase|tara:strand:+ start:354 stop:1625 length:1272 start_codon:yes stop_codon:yes gene_type:complete
VLDLKLLRNSPEEVAHSLKRRGYEFDLIKWSDLENKRKSLQSDTEGLQAQLNTISKRIGELKHSKQDSSKIEKEATKLTSLIKAKSKKLDTLLQTINGIVMEMPNMPDQDVPEGQEEKDNLEIRTHGTQPKFNFNPLDHLELGSLYDGIDMESGAKITGSRFSVLKSDFARLQRSLVSFMIDTHVNEHAYKEVYVPYIVNSQSLEGTGQLPKFEEDLFKLEGDQPYYLVPTAEVPVTNLLRDEIIESKNLPIKYVCHTPCFRSEAGSYGKDTKGIMRLHQFEKVELVQAVEEADSEQALEDLTMHAESILKKLELPYRVVSVCSGDLGFAAAKTYDLEAWIPSQDTFREISSCSNFRSFQARRMKARWKNPSSGKVELLNTLNGSGLALSRTLLALVENFQQKDGSISIPDVLRDYFKSDKIS